jgi:hypothetical protein
MPNGKCQMFQLVVAIGIRRGALPGKEDDACERSEHANHHLAFAIWHLPFGICHLAFAIWHLPFGICHLAFAIDPRQYV